MKEEVLEHPELGHIVYNQELEWWESEVELRPSCQVNFRLSTWTGTRPKLILEELVRLGVEYLDRARRYEPSCRERIADELLGVYNEYWADEDEASGPLTRKEFLERITPYSITLETDGESTWYYKDGGLFAGHWIEVRMHADKSIFQIGLAG